MLTFFTSRSIVCSPTTPPVSSLLTIITNFSSMSQPSTPHQSTQAVCLMLLFPRTPSEKMSLGSEQTVFQADSPFSLWSRKGRPPEERVCKLAQLRQMGWGGPLRVFMWKGEVVRNLNQVVSQ